MTQIKIGADSKFSRRKAFEDGFFTGPTVGTVLSIERRTRVRYFLAFWLFILSAVAFLDRTNISVAILSISHEYGLGNQRLGWVFSAFLIGYAVFQVPAGVLAARVGPRKVLTFG